MSFGDRTRKCEIVIDHDQVASGGSLATWPMLLSWDGSNGNLPTEPLDADGSYPAQADGGDLATYADEDGDSRLALQISGWTPANDTANAKAQLWTADPDGIWYPSSVSDTSLWLAWGDDEASQPASDAAYGSEDVWTAYEAVWHLDDLNDSTGNGYTLTAYNAPTSGAMGKIGTCYDFNGSTQYLYSNAAPVTNYPFTLTVWANADDETTNHTAFFLGDKDGNRYRTVLMMLGAVAGDPMEHFIHAHGTAGTISVTGGNYAADTWYYLAGVDASTTSHALIYNGTNKSTSATSKVVSAWDRVAFGATADLDNQDYFNGSIDEARIAASALSDAWIAADYSSQNAPGTFAAAGEPEDIGGGEVVEYPDPVTAVWSIPTPTLADRISTSPVSASWSAPAPSLLDTVQVTPILAAWSAPSPTLREAISVAAIAATWSALAPTLADAIAVSPVVATWAAITPSIAKACTATPVVATWSVVQPGLPTIVAATPIVATWSIPTPRIAVSGPYLAVAQQVHLAGATIADTHLAGPAASATHQAGALAAQGVVQ